MKPYDSGFCTAIKPTRSKFQFQVLNPITLKIKLTYFIIDNFVLLSAKLNNN